MTPRISNLSLGVFQIAIGVAVLAGGYSGGLRNFASAESFPALIAVSMCGTGICLIATSWFAHRVPEFRWTWLKLFCATAIAGLVWGAFAAYFANYALLLGPSEYTTAIFLMLVIAIALGVRSHLRALGMALFGLLLSTVGIDIMTGSPRFTLGMEYFLEGLDFLVIVAGILVMVEALFCLVSPRYWLSGFGVLPDRNVTLSRNWALLLRLVSAFAIVALIWLVWELRQSGWDIALAVCFALFGTLCKLLGWNRLVLCFAFHHGLQLEQSLQRSMVISRSSLSVFVDRPLSLLHLILAFALIGAMFAFWLWRAKAARQDTAKLAPST